MRRCIAGLWVGFAMILATSALAWGQAARAAAPTPAAAPPALPTEPGQSKQVFEVKVGAKTVKFPAVVYVPVGYNQNKDKRPLHLFLHDADARGTDLAGVLKAGPDAQLASDAKLRETYTFLGLSPQCPPDRQWTDPEMIQALSALITDFAKRARVDEERVYVSGVGAGGAAACQLAMASPDRFAAVCPIAAPAVTPAQAPKLKYVAVCAVGDTHNAPSSTAARQTADALSVVGAEVTYTLVPSGAATAWQQLFAGPRLYEWLGSHHRLSPQERQQRDQRLQQLSQLKFPATPGFFKLSYPAIVDGKAIDVPFMVTVPVGYDRLQAVRWPVLLFNHGAGEANLDTALVHGPNCAVNSQPALKAWYPFVGVAPIWDNSPERMRAGILVLDEVIRRMRVDADRVYATGLSMGGLCTWEQAMEAPDRFAAIAPICSRVHEPATAGERVKYLSTWIIVGGADGDFTAGAATMADSLAKAKADFACTVVPGRDHGIWIPYYAEQRFYEWLLQHKRLTPEQRVALDKAPPAPAPAPATQPGTYRLAAQSAGGSAMRYGLYLPKGYVATASRKYPLLVYLHHESDKAMDFSMIVNWGPDTDPRKDEKLRNSFAMIAISPQCPAERNWTDPEVVKAVNALVAEVASKFPVDPQCIYVTGMGSGGAAAVQAAMEPSGRYAAAAAVFPGGLAYDQAAAKCSSPLWVITPAGDAGALRAAQQAASLFVKARVEFRASAMPAPPPPAVSVPYYTDPAFVEWLLKHRRTRP